MMDRDIKFRAFACGVMQYDITSFGTGLHGKIETVFLDGDEHSVVDKDSDVYAELMQYTGTSDQNGTKIYEGDIIESILYKRVYVMAVTFVNYGFWAISECEEWARCHLEVLDGSKTFVMGNIYENPELLKGE